MKRIIFSTIVLLMTITVLVAQNKMDKSQKAMINQIEQPHIELLTVETFKQKIMNYSKGENQWNYIGNKPCIIDFYADWCRPCRMLSPELEKIAEKFNGQIIIYKINTEKEKELAMLFSISSIPALLFVPTGNKTPQMILGYKNSEMLEKLVKELLLTK